MATSIRTAKEIADIIVQECGEVKAKRMLERIAKVEGNLSFRQTIAKILNIVNGQPFRGLPQY